MATWKRKVTVADDGHGLVVELDDEANPSGRDDPPHILTIRPSDKPAIVLYRGDGVSLTAVVMEGGDDAAPGLAWHVMDDALRVEDRGAAGATYRYHLTGRADADTLQTDEPQTHETPSEPRSGGDRPRSPE